MIGKVDPTTAAEIDRIVWRTLRDAGQSRPPVHVETVLEHLRLYRDFYDLQDPGFLSRAQHRLSISGRKLVEIIKKVRLVAALFADEQRIVIAKELPPLKHAWPTCHEATHRILPWHKPYFYGDTAQELDEDYHQSLEAEANYGASAMMLCGPVFDAEAKDSRAEWAAFKALADRYGKSMTCTLRRYVQRGPGVAMAALVSTPWWKDKPDDQAERWRYFIPSPKFVDQFPEITPGALLSVVDQYAEQRRGGPVADFACPLTDANGATREFRGETFFNRHYLLTLLTELRALSPRGIVA
jgi:Zn-dependent peptidase ImmA (M78 family)